MNGVVSVIEQDSEGPLGFVDSVENGFAFIYVPAPQGS